MSQLCFSNSQHTNFNSIYIPYSIVITGCTLLSSTFGTCCHFLEFICLFCVFKYVCPLRVLDSTGMCVFGCPCSPQDVKCLMLVPGELIKIPPSGGCHNHPRQTAPPCCIVMLPICLSAAER